MNPIKTSFKLYFLLGNKFKYPPSHISLNLVLLVTSSAAAQHVGSNAPEGNPHTETLQLTLLQTLTRVHSTTWTNAAWTLRGSLYLPAQLHPPSAARQEQFKACLRHFASRSLLPLNISMTWSYKPTTSPLNAFDIRHRHIRFNPRPVATSARTYCD